MTARPYTADRSRYPYVLRDERKKPVCAVYNTGLIDPLTKFPILQEEVLSLRTENDRLSKQALGFDRNELISLLERLHGTIPGALVELRDRVSETLSLLRDTTPVVSPKAQVGLALPRPDSITPTRPELGQVWMSKRKTDDLYEIVEVRGDMLVLKWLGSYDYIREMTADNLQKRYSFHSIKQLEDLTPLPELVGAEE